MTPRDHESLEPALIRAELEAYIDRAVERSGGSTDAIRPDHRVVFKWPPHPLSFEFKVKPSDWTESASFTAHGETFSVLVARTQHGVFGKCEELWVDARGESLDVMLANLLDRAEPLLHRQRLINQALERPGRFVDHVPDLGFLDLLKLFYCEDRDVGFEAMREMEIHAKEYPWLSALLIILDDRRHPFRRAAQWFVLDLFEDLPSFARTQQEQLNAISAMEGLLWDAEDDFARTVYKAGVVLGGHVGSLGGAEALLRCLSSDSRIGRRSAIHALFHVVEWTPELREEIVEALTRHAETEEDPQLRDFALAMAKDIDRSEHDHIPEPVFDGEA
jgi:hypothetical protein